MRNTDQNIQRVPNPAQASTPPLYLTPPPPGYRAPGFVVADQLRHLASSLDHQPSASIMAQISGLSESKVQQILKSERLPTQSVLPQPASRGPESVSRSANKARNCSQVLSTLLRTALAKEDGRAEKLGAAYPRLKYEDNCDYAARLVMLSADSDSIAALTGISQSTIYKLNRTAVALKDGRAEHLRFAFPRGEGESPGVYARRLLLLSSDNDAISAASGMALGSVWDLRFELLHP